MQQALYQKDVRVIYSLADHEKDRDSELLKYIWTSKFQNTAYITEIDGVELEIKDFQAPTQPQLTAISSDATKRMHDGEHILSKIFSICYQKKYNF